MIKNIILFIALWFCGLAAVTQTLPGDSLIKVISTPAIIKSEIKMAGSFNKKRNAAPVTSVTNDAPIVINICDDDLDGFSTINIDSINTEVLLQTGHTHATPGILIGTLSGKIIKVNDLENTPYITDICVPVNPNIWLADIAIDQALEIFVCGGSSIYQVNEASCNLQEVLNTSIIGAINSLSFDRHDNLYFGGSSTSVARCDAGTFTPYIWHNFLSGYAGGDFVMLDDKMYIAWVVGGLYRLFEVTVDANINYVSHVDLGVLPFGTFGLASEYGKLYGVTTTQLYKIILNGSSFSVQTVLNNTSSDQWGGAAGLHEANAYDVQAFETLGEAQTLTNPLPGQWINTIPGGQTIYVAVINIITHEVEIFPVLININVTPVNAGPDQSTCNTTITMAGNVPASGNGLWELLSGSGVTTNPADPLTTVTNLLPGDNIFKWTIDNNTCIASDTVTIHNDPPTIPGFAALPAICSGNTAPVLPLVSTNGITGTWSPATVSNTVSGIYTFTPNPGECATVVQLTQTVVPTVTPDFAGLPALCAGNLAPVLVSTSPNGVRGTWSPGTVSNTVTGIYTFTPDAGQCALPVQLTQIVIPKVIPAFNAFPDICSGNTAPVLPGTSLNGVTGTWNPATVSNAHTGTYTFTPDAGECAFVTQVVQKVNSSVASFVSLAPVCTGDAVPLLADTSVEGVHGTWQPAVINNMVTATYTFTPDAGNSCAVKPFTLTQQVNPRPIAFAGYDGLAAIGVPYQLQAIGGISYQWIDGAAFLDNPHIANPKAIITDPVRFTVKVTDINGCSAMDDVSLKLYNGTTYYIPNAFTPNGDGKNDVLKAIPAGVSSTGYFNIYNRWGQLVFTTSDLSIGWDGNFNGTKQPSGSYIWMIKGVTVRGETIEMKGTVQLIR